MEIGAGSGQEACGRATQNASKIEKVEEKIDGCSAQEAEIEPPTKTRLEPLGRPGASWKPRSGRFCWGLAARQRKRPGKALAGPAHRPGSPSWHPARRRPWQALPWQAWHPGWEARPWQALAGPEKPASGGPVLF